jgi:hypothetical protein
VFGMSRRNILCPSSSTGFLPDRVLSVQRAVVFTFTSGFIPILLAAAAGDYRPLAAAVFLAPQEAFHMFKQDFVRGTIRAVFPKRGYGIITRDGSDYHFYYDPNRADHAFVDIDVEVKFVVVDRSQQRKTNPHAIDKAKWLRAVRMNQEKAA